MIRAAIAGFALVLLAGAHEAEIRYFTNVREVQVTVTNKQNFVVVDQEIWQHSRSDLADIRLYDGAKQVPYTLQQQAPRSNPVEQTARILNLGQIGDHTEFDVEIGAIPQYDRVRLKLDAKDFVVTALVFGENVLNQKPRTQLGPSTLYDFSREKLGSNSVLQLPTSSFPYLHVQLSPGIRPEQVKGVTVSDVQERLARWTNAGACQPPRQEGKNTVLTCELFSGMPLERLQFEVPVAQVNFRRNLSVRIGDVPVAGGEISRVRMNRAGTGVTSEQLALDITAASDRRGISVTIANEDNAPLQLTSVRPLALERRIYFDPAGSSSLRLYYGDAKLQAPTYDYAKFFQEDTSAAPAQLGPGMHNAEYAGRPDERPWSERHSAILWAAMFIAVAVLAWLAIRGLTAKPRVQA